MKQTAALRDFINAIIGHEIKKKKINVLCCLDPIAFQNTFFREETEDSQSNKFGTT